MIPETSERQRNRHVNLRALTEQTVMEFEMKMQKLTRVYLLTKLSCPDAKSGSKLFVKNTYKIPRGSADKKGKTLIELSFALDNPLPPLPACVRDNVGFGWPSFHYQREFPGGKPVLDQ